MLLLAAFSLTGFFRLAKTVSNSTVAVASTLLTAIYPVFFAQSSLAQVDLPAAGLVFWALESYFAASKSGDGDLVFAGSTSKGNSHSGAAGVDGVGGQSCLSRSASPEL